MRTRPRPNSSACISCGRKCGGETVRHRVQLILPGRRTVVSYCDLCSPILGAAFDRVFDAMERARPFRQSRRTDPTTEER